MRKLMIGVGAVVAVFGLLFLLQGSGAMGGTGGMNNNHFWIYAGAVIAIVGLVVLTLGFRRART